MKSSPYNDKVAHQIRLGAQEEFLKYCKMASELLQDSKSLILEAHLRLVGLTHYCHFDRALSKKLLMHVPFFYHKAHRLRRHHIPICSGIFALLKPASAGVNLRDQRITMSHLQAVRLGQNIGMR
jgi:hypothetical protein